MTLEQFLVWDAPAGARWHLVDGEPRALAPANRTHGRIQARLVALIDAHLTERGGPCTVIAAPGVVPHGRFAGNFHIPDLAVTCSPYEQEELILTDQVLIIEVLSPSSAAETWANVAAYMTIPSVREILIVRSTEIGADLLRPDAAGDWPERAVTVTEGSMTLASIGFGLDITAVYRGTRLGPG